MKRVRLWRAVFVAGAIVMKWGAGLQHWALERLERVSGDT